MTGRLDRMILGMALRRMLAFLAAVFALLVLGQSAYFAGQGAPPELIAALLAPMMLFSLPLVVPMAVAAAVMHAAGSLHREAHLQALAAAGVSPLRALRAMALPVAVAAVATGLMAHLVLPPAMERLQEGREQLAGALIDIGIAQRRAVKLGAASLWAESSERGRLRDAVVFADDDSGRSVLFASGGRVRRIELDGGSRQTLELDGPRMLRLGAAGGIEALAADGPLRVEQERARLAGLDPPESWPTARAWAAWRAGAPADGDDDAWSTYNAARLALWTRWMLPVAVAVLALAGAGLGVRLGRNEALLALGCMALLTIATIYPATAFTLAGSPVGKPDPLWIMVPVLSATAACGAILLRSAQRQPGRLLPRRGA